MESMRSTSANNAPLPLLLPHRTLIVLCGPAGCGKSTFAQRLIRTHNEQGLTSTMIVSSDYCRALVCDDESNQNVNRETFDLFHYIIHKRMFLNRLTISDSTALQPDARRKQWELAQRHQYYTCVLLFNISTETCLLRNRERSHRQVEERVIQYHAQMLQQALQTLPQEGWNQVHILDEGQVTAGVSITLI